MGTLGMFQPDGDATIQVGKSEHWLHDELLSTLSAQDQHVPMGLRLPDQQPHQDKPPQESAPSSFQLFATDVGTVLKAQPPWHDKMWSAIERLHSATRSDNSGCAWLVSKHHRQAHFIGGSRRRHHKSACGTQVRTYCGNLAS